jgi:hypothetical protein
MPQKSGWTITGHINSDFRAAPHEVQLRPLSCHAAKKYERFQLVDFCPPSQTLYHMTVKQNLRFS